VAAVIARKPKVLSTRAIDMRLLNELTIRGAAPQLARLLAALERPLASGWRRDFEAESRLSGLGLPAGRTRCFACTAEGNRPAAALWLEARGGETLYVANIVPIGKRELSDDEYNQILADFHSRVLQPARDGLAIQTALTHNRVTPEAYLSPEAVHRLKAFSDPANKSSPHDDDCQRWREFIIQTHIEGADFDPLLLDQWLAEAGWPEDQRHHLVCEYESSHSLLAAYDEERLEKCLP
jgi:hypothetical protein